jgi:H+/Cl- antiporter ClcA
MSFNVEKRYQDIAFFNIEQKPPPKKSNTIAVVAITVVATVALLAVGYVAGAKAGLFAPPCCVGALDFDFEFGRQA